MQASIWEPAGGEVGLCINMLSGHVLPAFPGPGRYFGNRTEAQAKLPFDVGFEAVGLVAAVGQEVAGRRGLCHPQCCGCLCCVTLGKRLPGENPAPLYGGWGCVPSAGEVKSAFPAEAP